MKLMDGARGSQLTSKDIIDLLEGYPDFLKVDNHTAPDRKGRAPTDFKQALGWELS